MTHGGLFSGIGGFDLGFERAGIKTVWQVEIDPYCRKVLERHFPKAKRYEDIRAVLSNAESDLWRASGHERQEAPDGGSLEPVSIISGGFPCQPVSQAGKRKGKDDSRYLWPEMFAVIRTLKPAWVVAENVCGLITHDGGSLLDKVYDDLEGEGYETLPPIVLPACAFGAPHRRDRVWIVAHARSGRRPAPRGAEFQRQQGEATSKCGGDIPDAYDRRSQIGRPEGPASVGGLRQHRQTAGDIGTAAQEPDSFHADASEPGLAIRSRKENGRRTVRQEGQAATASDWWAVEPDVGRVAHGIPSRVDRLKGLGNAIVPQIAGWIGRQIIEAEKWELSI